MLYNRIQKWGMLVLLMNLYAPAALASMEIAIRIPAVTSGDTRAVYTANLLTLLLDKTKPEFGDYHFVDSPHLTTPRELSALNQHSIPNMIVDENYEKKIAGSNITYINFPVDRGLASIRICFMNKALKKRVGAITSVQQLKKFTFVQGTGWADVKILKDNGFNVTEIPVYESLFKMVATGRVDFFCRGANEILDEYNQYKTIDGLAYDESFAISYPLPRFFILNKQDTLLKTRIEKGLEIALTDGSLKALWEKHNLRNLEFVKLHQRKIFRLTNKDSDGINKDYEKYLYEVSQR